MKKCTNCDGNCHNDYDSNCEFFIFNANYNMNFKLHNENGPAIKRPNGTQVWYLNGLVSRLDGPAYIYTPSKESIPTNELYYINGQLFSKENYWKHPDVIKYQYLKNNPHLTPFI